MNPTYEDQYLSLHPTKEVVYRDIYNFNVLNKSVGADLTTLLTNGISNPKTLLIVPILSASSSTATTNNSGILTGVSGLTSPFSTEGGTTSPLLAISEFNVQISGLNVFPANYKYDYEAFLNELARQGVNGGITTGLSSGLIGQHDFEHGYRFYVVDLSRRLPLDDTVAKSIQILGKNESQKIVDYYTFIEYERRVTLDLQTGAIIQV